MRKVNDAVYYTPFEVGINSLQLNEATPSMCDRLHSRREQKCTVKWRILTSAAESAHTPGLVEGTENMAAAERAANLRK